VVLGVCRYTAVSQRTIARKYSVTFPLLMANTLMPAPYSRVIATPTYAVIDRKGVIRGTAYGVAPGSLERVISPLLKEKAPRAGRRSGRRHA
jgi:peroxiredoxin